MSAIDAQVLAGGKNTKLVRMGGVGVIGLTAVGFVCVCAAVMASLAAVVLLGITTNIVVSKLTLSRSEVKVLEVMDTIALREDLRDAAAVVIQVFVCVCACVCVCKHVCLRVSAYACVYVRAAACPCRHAPRLYFAGERGGWGWTSFGVARTRVATIRCWLV